MHSIRKRMLRRIAAAKVLVHTAPRQLATKVRRQ
jgi:hypothetical protein